MGSGQDLPLIGGLHLEYAVNREHYTHPNVRVIAFLRRFLIIIWSSLLIYNIRHLQ